MQIPKSQLDAAVQAGILTAGQADRLARFLEDTPADAERPRFGFVHVLYYLGGMIAIGAMSLFMTLGWNAMGGWGGFFCAVFYCMLALALAHWFLERKRLAVPAGLMAALGVVVVLVGVFGVAI